MNEAPDGLFSIHIQAPRERVWDALTDTSTRQAFYFDSCLDTALTPGSALKYCTPDRKRTFIVGEVLEVEPPNRFVHSFRFSDLKDPPTKVTIILTEEAGGTRVTLSHGGLGTAPNTAKRVAKGWPHILGNLESWLVRGKLPLKTRIGYAMMKVMMPLMPKSKPTTGV
jgi:uncharacterized protein YndB with AHSA1/START domain